MKNTFFILMLLSIVAWLVCMVFMIHFGILSHRNIVNHTIDLAIVAKMLCWNVAMLVALLMFNIFKSLYYKN